MKPYSQTSAAVRCREIYNARRAARECTDCGKPDVDGARCEGCLAAARRGGDRAPATLEEIARVIGVTRERARQLQEQALHKLARLLPAGDAIRGLAAPSVAIEEGRMSPLDPVRLDPFAPRKCAIRACSNLTRRFRMCADCRARARRYAATRAAEIARTL